jgi:hypothetical protein
MGTRISEHIGRVREVSSLTANGRFEISAWVEGGLGREGRWGQGSCPRRLLSGWLVNCLTFQVLLNTRQ